jgi:hypothetical protein
MRALDFLGIQRFVLSADPDEAYVLLVKSQEVETFHDEAVLLRNACIIYLQHNSLQSEAFPVLWKKFPNAWWVDLSHNRVSALVGKIPRAIGLLNLFGTNVTLINLSTLSCAHILRLHVPVSLNEELGVFTTLNALISSVLPNVWAVNDDFITSSDRKEATLAGLPPNTHVFGNELDVDIVSDAAQPNLRVQNIIRVVQNCPPRGKYADYFRLEILLEEYLQEACYFNCFAQQIHLQNNSSHRTIEPMPFVDVFALMMLPHRIRLDLTVVLTAALMFHIPRNLLRDALVICMGQHISADDIDQMYALPTFVKTALVCLLRRITTKEALEWNTIQQFCPKPTRHVPLQPQKLQFGKNPPPPSDYLDSRGFEFLRPAKQYLEQAIEVTVTDPKVLQAMVPFSELEMEILNKLPDVPTRSSAASYFRDKAEEASRGQAMSTASYKEWIPFAARHTVLLLTKAPACPPLTRPQHSKVKQELYFEMLPILRAANMTMNDLDLAFTGPGKDGRMLNSRTTTSGTSVKIKNFGSTLGTTSAKADAPQVAETGSVGKEMALMGGNALPFGVGLPKAVPDSALSWKVQEVPRNYYKGWSAPPVKPAPSDESVGFTDDIESRASKFFLTEDEPKPPMSYSVRTTSNLSVTQYDIGAPAPLPRNRSISTPPHPSRMRITPDGSSDALLQDISATCRASPPRATRSPHSYSHGSQGDYEVGGGVSFRSVSVSVPATNPTSTNHSVQSEQTPTDERSFNVEAEESVFTHTSSADSEPFGLLSAGPDSPSMELSAYEPHLAGIAEAQGASSADMTAASQQYSQQWHSQQPVPAQQQQQTRHKTGAVRPEHISGVLARPVLGFSADANWSNKFLLAPPSAVAQSNYTAGRGDPANCWNFIEYAPVIVHSPSKRLSQDALKSILAEEQGAFRGSSAHADETLVFDDSLQTSRPRSVGATRSLQQQARALSRGRQEAAAQSEVPGTAPELSSSGEAGLYLVVFCMCRYGAAVAQGNGHSAQCQKSQAAEQPTGSAQQGDCEHGTANVRYLSTCPRPLELFPSRALLICYRSEEDASLSISQSQEPSMAFGEEDEDQWDAEPSRRTPTFEDANSAVFLTGVSGQEHAEEECAEDEGAEFDEDAGPLPPQSPHAPGRNGTSRSYVELSGPPPYGELPSDAGPTWSAAAYSAPLDSSVSAPGNEHTGRHIPIPLELLEDPLKELRSSVSTLDILMKKTNYSNIHVNRSDISLWFNVLCAKVPTRCRCLVNPWSLGRKASTTTLGSRGTRSWRRTCIGCRVTHWS